MKYDPTEWKSLLLSFVLTNPCAECLESRVYRLENSLENGTAGGGAPCDPIHDILLQ